MSEIIDRAATALYESTTPYRKPETAIPHFAAFQGGTKAVIAAIRAPSQAMLDAAAGFSDPISIWQAMIDAALKD